MLRTTIGLCAILSLAASSQTWEAVTYPISSAPPHTQPAIRRADVIIASLQDAFLSELTRDLARGGPGVGIRTCHLDTIAAVQRVGREQAIAAGRTSDRLRNPLNAPRAWAAPIVQRYAGSRAGRIEGFAVDLGDRVGVMRPIAHRAACNSCHGSADQLTPLVKAALSDRYTVDRAIGFNEGEVRGWFWVEVPREKSR